MNVGGWIMATTKVESSINTILRDEREREKSAEIIKAGHESKSRILCDQGYF